MAGFPVEPGAITREWLTDVMCERGVIAPGAVVNGVKWQRIGTGQVGDSIRLDLTYAGGSGPASLVAKLASPDPTSRATAAAFQLYRKEVSFYLDVAPHISVRVPDLVTGFISDDGCDFLLLFEDLGPARGGNQLAGCTIEDARAAIRQAAALHGVTAGNEAMLSAEWLQPRPGLGEQLMALYPQAQAVFRDRYADMLEPELMAVCEALAEHADLWFGRTPLRPGLVHGDFRLDNMLFGIKGGAEPIAVLDWQTVAIGDGLTDIGYFLGCGIGSALRRPHERELLALYADTRAACGAPVNDRELNELYPIGALHGVSTAVFSSANVVRTERGDANFLSMARGACELALDHDSLGALKRASYRG